MASTTLKVTDSTRDRVRAIGSRAHQTADQVINAALDELERRRFWEEYAAAARLDQLTPEEITEREAWDETLADELE